MLLSLMSLHYYEKEHVATTSRSIYAECCSYDTLEEREREREREREAGDRGKLYNVPEF